MQLYAISESLLKIARVHITAHVNDNIVNEHSVGSMIFCSSACNANFWKHSSSTCTKKSIRFSHCCGEDKDIFTILGTYPM